MQVFALVLLAVASVSAKGSGPYLPSGWRPQGPAFYLPSEVKTSSESPKEIVLEGSEASGSDFLREYGPPVAQEVSQNLINQGLPDITIEQTFGAAQVEIKNEAAAQPVVSVTEALIEQLSEAVTESFATEEKSTVSEPLAEVEKAVETSQTTVSDDVEATKVELLQLENEASSEGSTESVQLSENSVATQVASEESQSTPADVEVAQVTLIVENVSEQVSQESANQEATTQQEQQQVSQTESTEQSEVSLTGSGELEGGVSLLQVQNIPDIIASLENEEKVQEAEVSQAVVSEVSGAGAVEQAPEGFLEYGPPGFAEYGPPKGDLNQEEKQADQSFEYNETRRRRFSPKFRHTKKQ